ncbi:MAG: hypothetical protein AAFR38_11595 [Planctomycetota bacterium]
MVKQAIATIGMVSGVAAAQLPSGAPQLAGEVVSQSFAVAGPDHILAVSATSLAGQTAKYDSNGDGIFEIQRTIGTATALGNSNMSLYELGAGTALPPNVFFYSKEDAVGEPIYSASYNGSGVFSTGSGTVSIYDDNDPYNLTVVSTSVGGVGAPWLIFDPFRPVGEQWRLVGVVEQISTDTRAVALSRYRTAIRSAIDPCGYIGTLAAPTNVVSQADVQEFVHLYMAPNLSEADAVDFAQPFSILSQSDANAFAAIYLDCTGGAP